MLQGNLTHYNLYIHPAISAWTSWKQSYWGASPTVMYTSILQPPHCTTPFFLAFLRCSYVCALYATKSWPLTDTMSAALPFTPATTNHAGSIHTSLLGQRIQMRPATEQLLWAIERAPLGNVAHELHMRHTDWLKIQDEILQPSILLAHDCLLMKG